MSKLIIPVKKLLASILRCFLHQINQIPQLPPACHSLAFCRSCSVTDALCAASAATRPKGNPRSLGQKIGGVHQWIFCGFCFGWNPVNLPRFFGLKCKKILGEIQLVDITIHGLTWVFFVADPGFLDYPAGFYTIFDDFKLCPHRLHHILWVK